MPVSSQEPAVEIEAALVRIRRSQQRGRLARAAAFRPDSARFRCLDALEDAADGTSTSALAEAVGVDRPRITRLVDGLAAEKLLRRTVDPDDGRRVLVSLTVAGREVVRAMHADRLAAVRQALGALVVDDRADLARLLTEFLDGWEALRN